MLFQIQELFSSTKNALRRFRAISDPVGSIHTWFVIMNIKSGETGCVPPNCCYSFWRVAGDLAVCKLWLRTRTRPELEFSFCTSKQAIMLTLNSWNHLLICELNLLSPPDCWSPLYSTREIKFDDFLIQVIAFEGMLKEQFNILGNVLFHVLTWN